MNHYTPIIIPVLKHEDPECPHCHQKLVGWSEPSDVGFLAAFVIIVVIFQLFGFGVGVMEGMSKYPDDNLRWFSKRWHYLLPTVPLGHYTGKFLNKDTGEQE